MSSTKRADLQGIRGLAILAVLLFHFFPEYFPNGYIGVDQFFVLSGFLISMILSRSEVSLKGIYTFYYRRVKRIVPMYLFVITLILISLFVAFPETNLQLNIDSAWYALLFYMNMAKISHDNAYAVELKLAKDAFTHTWSLAVEMQFYLLVPFIFLISRDRLQKSILFSVVALSLGYSVLTDSNTSFNSVLARLWQFCIGSFANMYCNERSGSSKIEETCSLLNDQGAENEEAEPKKGVATSSFVNTELWLASMMMFLTVMIQFYPLAAPTTMLRVSLTILTAGLIIIGERTSLWLQSNKCITWFGDISYSLYLVHWPVYTYVKLEYYESTAALLAGFLGSILLAWVLKETYEKFYLRMNGTGIAVILVLLYAVNFGIIYNQKSITTLTCFCEHTRQLTATLRQRNYKNVTKEEAIEMNKWWMPGLHDQEGKKNICIYRHSQNAQLGVCDFNNTLKNQEFAPSSLIIGNSYAPNLAGTLNEECRSRFSSMTIAWHGVCDILVDTPIVKKSLNCPILAKHYLSHIKELRPDVLYIITRHIKLMGPLSNKNVTLDEMFIEARDRLDGYQKFVGKRIYILDASPRPAFIGPTLVVRGLETGKMPSHKDLMDNVDIMPARSRMRELLKTCKKCRLIDLLPAFTKRGHFQMYDQESGLLYYNSGAHLTPLALEKIRPTLRATCHEEA